MNGNIAVLTVRGNGGGTSAVVTDATAAEQMLREMAKKHGVDPSLHMTASELVRAFAAKGTVVRLRGAQWSYKGISNV